MRKDKRNNILFYLLPFASLVLSCVAVAFAVVAYKQQFITQNTSTSSDYMNLLTSIIGVMFAFSAISIYSIFNANIDQTKERLFEKIDRIEEENLHNTERFDARIETLLGQIDDLKLQIELLDQKNRQYNLIFLITSPYTNTFQKESAIMELLVNVEQGTLLPEIIEECRVVINKYSEITQKDVVDDRNTFYCLLNKFLEQNT